MKCAQANDSHCFCWSVQSMCVHFSSFRKTCLWEVITFDFWNISMATNNHGNFVDFESLEICASNLKSSRNPKKKTKKNGNLNNLSNIENWNHNWRKFAFGQMAGNVSAVCFATNKTYYISNRYMCIEFGRWKCGYASVAVHTDASF